MVLAGLDPSGGAGIAADIEAVAAVGAHALPIVTALTVQDNDRVYAVNPVDAEILRHQALILSQKMTIAAIKIGIVGNQRNAEAIADVIRHLRKRQPDLPVVLDTVLGSGHGDNLSDDLPEEAMRHLLPLSTLAMPNAPEAIRLTGLQAPAMQAQKLLSMGAQHVLIKGGHSEDQREVINRWYSNDESHEWVWSRLPGAFHGSGCTLASAAAGLLANGKRMREALGQAQQYAHHAIMTSYRIAQGQRIPNRRPA